MNIITIFAENVDQMPQVNNFEETLQAKGVRVTANRLLVLRALAAAEGPVNLAALEEALETVDKGSIFRVLTLFAEADVVHAFEDGSGSVKYELCHGAHHHHTPDDQHPHFFCERCGRTVCLDDVAVPAVAVPAGFSVHTVNYTLKGLCPRCSQIN